jgi:hypothetical protein
MTGKPNGAYSASKLPWGHGFSLDKSGILVNFELVQKGLLYPFAWSGHRTAVCNN